MGYRIYLVKISNERLEKIKDVKDNKELHEIISPEEKYDPEGNNITRGKIRSRRLLYWSI